MGYIVIFNRWAGITNVALLLPPMVLSITCNNDSHTTFIGNIKLYKAKSFSILLINIRSSRSNFDQLLSFGEPQQLRANMEVTRYNDRYKYSPVAIFIDNNGTELTGPALADHFTVIQ